MNTLPLITVILLCYNHEKFVEEAVNGVFSQTYPALEIIIFDDCSADRTADIVESVVANRSRPNIQFIRNTRNMSGHAVSQIGLSMAKGDYIFFSCGDDVMFPNMIDEMANVLIREDKSLVTANALYIDEFSNSLDRTWCDPAVLNDESFETLARNGSNSCCFGAAIGFERAIYDKFGWVPTYLRAYDIMYPFYAYLLKGAKFINKPLLKYRVHGRNASLSLRAEKADTLERRSIDERIYLGHLAHAVLMEEELNQLCQQAPKRYTQMAEQIVPLLNIQMAEMGKKLIRSRRICGEF